MNPDDLLRGLLAHVEEGGTPVPSPCVAVCRMDPQRALCLGCRRTIAEISAWRQLDDAGKRLVWRDIGQRLAHESQATQEAAGGTP
jgi:predicted Fe-S protein YdhL (DUF1289 family)